jgi:2-polyprenyl-3-methyl-5-hydroxy-6-metoxy-1,4-benzoquinol methylase
MALSKLDTDIAAVRTCGDADVEAGRGPGQLGWYQFAGAFVRGKEVLDVGCGLGHGLRILAASARRAEGQDLDSRLAAPGVRIGPLTEVAAKSFDVVVSIDVIEHVDDPSAFLGQLVRVAREGIFLSTPNWTASRCRWPFHLREYTPREFELLLAPFGTVTLFKGTPDGRVVHPVGSRFGYYLFNDLRNWPPSAIPTRCLNYLLPSRFKIHSHNAAWMRLA